MATIGFIAATRLLTSQGWEMEHDGTYWNARKDKWRIEFLVQRGAVQRVYLYGIAGFVKQFFRNPPRQLHGRYPGPGRLPRFVDLPYSNPIIGAVLFTTSMATHKTTIWPISTGATTEISLFR